MKQRNGFKKWYKENAYRVEMCHKTKKIPSLSYCHNNTHSLHLSECLSPSLIPALYIELGNLHRQTSYQSQFPCLPTSIRFGGVKSTDQLITLPSLILRSQRSLAQEKITTASAYTELDISGWLHRCELTCSKMAYFQIYLVPPLPVVITHCVTWDRPLLPGTPPDWDDRGFRWILIHWADICIWTAGHNGISR